MLSMAFGTLPWFPLARVMRLLRAPLSPQAVLLTAKLFRSPLLAPIGTRRM
jgi:hypothetical protein